MAPLHYNRSCMKSDHACEETMGTGELFHHGKGAFDCGYPQVWVLMQYVRHFEQEHLLAGVVTDARTSNNRQLHIFLDARI